MDPHALDALVCLAFRTCVRAPAAAEAPPGSFFRDILPSGKQKAPSPADPQGFSRIGSIVRVKMINFVRMQAQPRYLAVHMFVSASVCVFRL
jgi:hypothetical protein